MDFPIDAVPTPADIDPALAKLAEGTRLRHRYGLGAAGLDRALKEPDARGV